MCLIAKKALTYPKFCEIVAKTSYVKPPTNKHPEEKLRQFNHLLRPGRFFYSQAIGNQDGIYVQSAKTYVARLKMMAPSQLL
jgi:D-alanyl-D-alanine carboxypeptidase (penicillin-binding protein 5/6)